MPRSVILAFVSIISFLFSGSALAQFSQHYQETTFLLSQSGVQPAIAYLPIPRTGWPVRVQISAVDSTNVSVQASSSFLITDGLVGNPLMTLPVQAAIPGTQVFCQDNGPDAVVECFITPSVSVGHTDSNASSQPHRMFVKLSNCNCTWLFRITMWY